MAPTPSPAPDVARSIAAALDTLRVGHGFDVHRWTSEPERPLVLGGVTFGSDRALQGHSDADVVAHCCIDAVLSGTGLGDIGQMFSDRDPRWRNANSVAMLAAAAEMAADHGWRIINIDCTVITDEPKIAPNRDQMEQNLSAAVNAPVAIKGKTTEMIDALAEGIQGHAVALVVKR